MAYSYRATVINGSLNLRSSTSSASTRLTSIPDGTSITVTTCSNNEWFRTSYNGYTGYVKAEYVWILSGMTVGTVYDGRLRLRRTPESGDNMIGWLADGRTITILHESANGFWRVSDSALGTGWASMEYIHIG